MIKPRKFLFVPLLALLFVGSGCDDLLLEGILKFGLEASGSPGVGPKDAIGATSTGDKDKDGILDLGIGMGEDIKKATELESDANAALTKKPPDTATALEKLDEALKLRPDDWSLKNQKLITQAELGGAAPTLNHPAHLCPEDKHGDVQNRCLFGSVKERSALLEASVARQKRSDQLVSCATQETMQRHYDFLGRLVPDELAKLGYSEAQGEEFLNKSRAAEAATKSPGVTCRR